MSTRATFATSYYAETRLVSRRRGVAVAFRTRDRSLNASMDGGCPRTNPRSSAEDDQASGRPGAVQQRWSAWTALIQDTRGSTRMRPPAHLRSAALPASLPCNTADGSHPGLLLASPSRRPAGGGPIHKAEAGRPSAACGREREAPVVPAPADGPPLGRECTSGDPCAGGPVGAAARTRKDKAGSSQQCGQSTSGRPVHAKRQPRPTRGRPARARSRWRRGRILSVEGIA
jgi:hypothetical protein